MSNVQNPVVSVIVPARNEEACLALCLESLVSQTGIDFEIIVVDDASTDRTAEIAQSLAVDAAAELRASESGTTGKGTSSTRAELVPRLNNNGTAGSRALTLQGGQTIARNCLALTVVSAPPLSENWTGKNNAMSAGAKIAKGKWLLFTDADTVHKPASLARALAEAEQHGASLLSYSPEQEVRTFWEKAVMPVIFAELAATYPPDKVNDPSSQIAAANGQYLLISREAYDAVGGHTKIASDLLEDVAMARLVKSSGRKIFFRYGGDAVRTRMYRNWDQMKEGWTKNLALLFKHPGWKAWNVGFYYYMTLGGFLFIALGVFGMAAHHRIIPWVSVLYMFFPVSAWLLLRRAHFSLAITVIALLLGPPVFVYLLLRSRSQNRNGKIVWKDRKYLPSPTE